MTFERGMAPNMRTDEKIPRWPAICIRLALLLVPDHAPPIAFVAGVLGPLIGADLLHLRDIEKIATGGAGTFDGIVLSGILAAYLA